MGWLLFCPLVCGWLVCRRVLKEQDWATSVAGACSLGLALTLLGVNFFYKHFTLAEAISFTLIIESVLAAGIFGFVPSPVLEKRQPITTWVLVIMVLASCLVYFYATATQTVSPDDDYWIHTPLQGLMLHGNFPPTNPFFSDIPMNGHYGRDLSLVIVAWLTGVDVFKVQMVMTTVVQLLTLWLMFGALKRYTGSELQALLGVIMLFYGVDVGGRAGLMDTLQNNNAFVHLYLALSFYLIAAVWTLSSWPVAVTAGAVLGGYAIVYETHFGLVVLTVLVLLLAPRRFSVSFNYPKLGLVLTLALILASTQGGPLTNLVQRKLSGKPSVDAIRLSKGMQNQSQVVKLKFPKDNLFQILLETGAYQRISCVYSRWKLLSRWVRPSVERGYRFIWSWEVLKIHFLPLYLFPFYIVYLYRKRCLTGIFFAVFGGIAFLVPALVDFGPVYESEYFRWQFAAGVGMATALGITLGSLLEQSFNSAERMVLGYRIAAGGIKLHLSSRVWGVLIIVLLLWIDTFPSRCFVREAWKEVLSRGGIMRCGVFFPSTPDWLRLHRVLDFEMVDWKAASWLEQRSGRGERLLTNFSQENNFSILFESTLTGVSGVRCVGHSLPLNDEPIGTTPYHMSAPAVAYWATLDPMILQELQVDWVYYRPTVERLDLRGAPGLKLAHLEEGEDGDYRLIYKVVRSKDRSTLCRYYSESYNWDSVIEKGRAELEGIPQYVRGGIFYSAVIKLPVRELSSLRNIEDGGVYYFLEYKNLLSGMVSSKVDRLVQHWEGKICTDKQVLLPLYVVPPREEGDYEVSLWMGDSEGAAMLRWDVGRLKVAFHKVLDSLEPDSAQLVGKVKPGNLVKINFGLQGPVRCFVGEHKLLATVAAWDLKRRRYYLLPGSSMSEVKLQVSSDGVWSGIVPVLLPGSPGSYRLDLFLSPLQGKVFRYELLEIDLRDG